jgi:hypothetical protein
VEGKTAEWKSKGLRAYQRRPEANSFRRAEELRPKCESRRSAPKLAAKAITLVRRSGVGHSRDRAAYRHDGTTELIIVRSKRGRTHMSVT